MAGDEEIFSGKFEAEWYHTLDSGIYLAEFIGINYGVGNFKQQPIFIPVFQILEGERAGQITHGIINQDSKKVSGRIWQMYYALTGVKLGKGDRYELLSLMGKRCYINVERKGRNNAIREYIHEQKFSDIKSSDRLQKL